MPSLFSRARESCASRCTDGKKRNAQKAIQKFPGIMARISAYHSGPISTGQNLATTYSNSKVGWKMFSGKKGMQHLMSS